MQYHRRYQFWYLLLWNNNYSLHNFKSRIYYTCKLAYVFLPIRSFKQRLFNTYIITFTFIKSQHWEILGKVNCYHRSNIIFEAVLYYARSYPCVYAILIRLTYFKLVYYNIWPKYYRYKYTGYLPAILCCINRKWNRH